MRKLLVVLSIFLLFGLGVAANISANPSPDVAIFPVSTLINAWFKYFHFPDGTQVIADGPNDHLYFENHSEECFRVSGDALTDTIHFALNPECISKLPIFIVEPYGHWGFNTETAPHDFTFQCNNWVCELGLWTAWNDYYGRQEHMAFSQDFADATLYTTTPKWVIANQNYTMELPVETPEVGQCLYVEEFIPNRTYVMGWKNC